ncbi:MAG: metallophosphoesterase family protein [Chloroflexi bacterium]|nr:metallophosphoesterase family protein [Chloroflexota bacterium]
MRIGLISDTHIAWERKGLPPQVMETFQGVDLILHAGDIYTHVVLDELERIAPVLAALGDDDYPGPDPRVKAKHILELEGLTLWLMHERPYNLTSELRESSLRQDKTSPGEGRLAKPDIIVVGHEHRTVVERSDDVLYINSGSPTLLNYQRGLGTVGMLELNSGKADVRIIHL